MSTPQTNHEPKATEGDEGKGDGEALDINETSRRGEQRGDDLQSRFDEEYQGESWTINANTEGDDD